MQKRKRFYVAIAIYAALGLLIWVTMEDVPLPVGNGHIGIRSLTLIVLAVFAVRTVLHFRAEQIRGEQDEEEVSADVAQLVEHSLGKTLRQRSVAATKRKTSPGDLC